jgi:hypothetical protein
MSVIKAGTTVTTALVLEGDTDGDLIFKTGSAAVTAMSISAAGAVSLPTSSLTISSGATLNGGVVVNEPGADVDFRIESDINDNAFFLDGANGAVGLNMAPSAWATGRTVLQLKGGATNGGAYLVSGAATQAYLGTNGYSDGSNFIYLTSAAATLYDQSSGAHSWLIAPSGTAGSPMSFTQALSVGLGTSLALQGATSQSGTGITFPATQSASSNANTLDDYEEGTWTPTILFGGANTSATYTFQVGTYTKIGNVVYYQAYVQESTASTSSGALTVGGLPFTSRNTSNLYMVGAAALDNAAVNIDQPVTQMLNNATEVRIASGTNTNNWNTLDQTVRGATFRVYVSGFYYI